MPPLGWRKFPTNAVGTAAAATEGPSSPLQRNSGGKRTREQAELTDVINTIPAPLTSSSKSKGNPPTITAAAATTNAPSTSGGAQKPKIRYFLPHQNMEEGHFYIVLGDDVDVSTQRFKILSLLGEGTFGKVVEAWDRARKVYCAVKIVRNVPKYVRDASCEAQFMERVRQADPEDNFAFTKLHRHFLNDSGHPCLVMGKHGRSLLNWIERYGPMPPRAIAEIIFHAGVALDLLHSELRLMHTDLKPENILFDTPSDAPSSTGTSQTQHKIRICDLGGCCDERHSKSAIVSTRHYRSPEVILGLGWMFSTDMWSMGCIIYELATGRLLYDTHDNLEHLHLMEKTIGRLPTEWASRCSDEGREHFLVGGVLKPPQTARSAQAVARAKPIEKVITDPLLRDLIYGLLQYDRTKRLNARQMACHPYVAKCYPESLQHSNHPNQRSRLPPPPMM